jgi:hypothetical protein
MSQNTDDIIVISDKVNKEIDKDILKKVLLNTLNIDPSLFDIVVNINLINKTDTLSIQNTENTYDVIINITPKSTTMPQKMDDLDNKIRNIGLLGFTYIYAEAAKLTSMYKHNKNNIIINREVNKKIDKDIFKKVLLNTLKTSNIDTSLFDIVIDINKSNSVSGENTENKYDVSIHIMYTSTAPAEEQIIIIVNKLTTNFDDIYAEAVKTTTISKNDENIIIINYTFKDNELNGERLKKYIRPLELEIDQKLFNIEIEVKEQKTAISLALKNAENAEHTYHLSIHIIPKLTTTSQQLNELSNKIRNIDLNKLYLEEMKTKYTVSLYNKYISIGVLFLILLIIILYFKVLKNRN